MKKVTEEISQIIWDHIWNNALPEDNDEELIREHTKFCEMYENDRQTFDALISIT